MKCLRVLCLLFVAFLSASAPLHAQTVGDSAADFTLETFDGRQIKLSELKGKGVCIMTWASWCPYCKASMPALTEYYDAAKKAGKNIEIVAVAIRDKPDKARQTYLDRALPYPTGIEDANFEKRYPLSRKTPSWILVDKEGIVRQVVSGRVFPNDIATMFKAIE